jgi:hypothetical protein
MFINLSSLSNIDAKLKTISDAVISDLEIDSAERLELVKSLNSFKSEVQNEI